MIEWLLFILIIAWVLFLIWLDRDPNSIICRAIRDGKKPQHRRNKDNACYEALTKTQKKDENV
jgi:hypothetical protein